MSGHVQWTRPSGGRTVSNRRWGWDHAKTVALDITIRRLFGQHCSGDVFQHDVLVGNAAENAAPVEGVQSQASTTTSSESVVVREKQKADPAQVPPHSQDTGVEHPDLRQSTKRSFDEYHEEDPPESQNITDDGSRDSQETALEIRTASWEAVISNAHTDEWKPIGLLSTTDNHTLPETELGRH